MDGSDSRASDLSTRLKQRLATGFAWNLLGSTFNQGSTVVVNVLLARLLGRESFGEFALVQSTLLAFSSVFQVSLGFTATRFLAEFHRKSPERAGRILGLCSLLSVCMAVAGALGMVASAHWLASSLLTSPQVEVPLAIAAAAVALNVFNGLQAGILAGFERYREIAQVGVLAGCTYVAVCVMAGSALGPQRSRRGRYRQCPDPGDHSEAPNPRSHSLAWHRGDLQEPRSGASDSRRLRTAGGGQRPIDYACHLARQCSPRPRRRGIRTDRRSSARRTASGL